MDANDVAVGAMEKLAAHQDGGTLHRAFSIFIFNGAGELLLQQRAAAKYHFGGLWTNTCCSHPRPEESTHAAAIRRLQEEFGFEAELKRAFSFLYEAADEASGLTEREYDHVFCGQFDGKPQPNAEEIESWRWVSLSELQRDMEARPQRYTPWFRLALPQLLRYRDGC